MKKSKNNNKQMSIKNDWKSKIDYWSKILLPKLITYEMREL